jgi:hypothetical protein
MPALGVHRDVLQVGVGAVDAPRGTAHLNKCGVHPVQGRERHPKPARTVQARSTW